MNLPSPPQPVGRARMVARDARRPDAPARAIARCGFHAARHHGGDRQSRCQDGRRASLARVARIQAGESQPAPIPLWPSTGVGFGATTTGSTTPCRRRGAADTVVEPASRLEALHASPIAALTIYDCASPRVEGARRVAHGRRPGAIRYVRRDDNGSRCTERS